jgi:hypothetical protein
MKTHTTKLLSILAVALFSMHSFAQEVTEGGARIEFMKEVHDYGEVPFGGDASTTFEFKNTGDQPLIISEARKSCGCTVPDYPKEPIMPGKTGVITVKYDSKRPGAINKSVTIVSNAINNPNAIIRIKGQVLPQPESGMPIQQVGPSEK